MDWRSLLLAFKESDRFGGLFVVSLLGFLTLVVAAAIIGSAGLVDYLDYLPPLIPTLGLAALVCLWAGIRRASNKVRERRTHQPLSRDEMRVARSKLVKLPHHKAP